MKKILKIFAAIFLLFPCFSCGNNDEPEFEKYDNVFVITFYVHDEIENKSINNLEVYYYETCYYYDVTYYSEYFKENLRMLYVLRYESLLTHFEINSEERFKENHPEIYNDFMNAKEKGVLNTYTKEDIEEMVEYYKTTL